MKQIGNYQLGKTIGTGTFSKVIEATHRITDFKVAIKVIKKKQINAQKMYEHIKREIKILKRFDHPHIIKLYQVLNTQKKIYMVMELVEGGELFDYVEKKGKLTEQQTRLILQQLISSVEYCHNHQIAHRDLKPENILMQDEKYIKLGDFGLSNIIRDSQYFKTSCGSPNYAAPEIISSKKYVGNEVDVWSIGVILYTLLSGTLPFDEESSAVLFEKIKKGKFSIPKFFSEQVTDLLLRILVVDPTMRITIQQIKKHP